MIAISSFKNLIKKNCF